MRRLAALSTLTCLRGRAMACGAAAPALSFFLGNGGAGGAGELASKAPPGTTSTPDPSAQEGGEGGAATCDCFARKRGGTGLSASLPAITPAPCLREPCRRRSIAAPPCEFRRAEACRVGCAAL